MTKFSVRTLILPFACLLGSTLAACLAEDGSLNFQSYNIRYLNDRDGEDVWSHRKSTVISTINHADVVGLQEVVLQQLKDIRAGTPDFEWYGVGRDDGAQKGEMTAIGWRTNKVDVEQRMTYWLSESPTEVGSKGWDAALPRIASVIRATHKQTAKPFVFINTHFDHRGATARTNSAKLIRRAINDNRDGLPTILVGDLNATKNDAPLIELLDPDSAESEALLDAREVAQQSDRGPDSTWNGFREIIPGRRIDHILVTGDLAVMRFETLDPRTEENRFASDHLPVQAEIRLDDQ